MMKGPKAGASSIATRAFRGVQAVAAGRERRERPSRCRHYLPLRRGSLRRASCVVVRCRRRAVAVLVLWIVEHSAGQVRAGVHRALLCCVRRGARQRNLLDELVPHLFQWLALPPPRTVVSVVSPSSSAHGYTCDIFPLNINTALVSIDSWFI